MHRVLLHGVNGLGIFAGIQIEIGDALLKPPLCVRYDGAFIIPAAFGIENETLRHNGDDLIAAMDAKSAAKRQLMPAMVALHTMSLLLPDFARLRRFCGERARAAQYGRGGLGLLWSRRHSTRLRLREHKRLRGMCLRLHRWLRLRIKRSGRVRGGSMAHCGRGWRVSWLLLHIRHLLRIALRYLHSGRLLLHGPRMPLRRKRLLRIALRRLCGLHIGCLGLHGRLRIICLRLHRRLRRHGRITRLLWRAVYGLRRNGLCIRRLLRRAALLRLMVHRRLPVICP